MSVFKKKTVKASEAVPLEDRSPKVIIKKTSLYHFHISDLDIVIYGVSVDVEGQKYLSKVTTVYKVPSPYVYLNVAMYPVLKSLLGVE